MRDVRGFGRVNPEHPAFFVNMIRHSFTLKLIPLSVSEQFEEREENPKELTNT